MRLSDTLPSLLSSLILLTGAIAGQAVADPAAAPTVTAIGGGLLVAPTSHEFEARGPRSAEFVLRNMGDAETTYRISLVNRRLDDTGQFVTVTEPGPEDRFADHLIRFSPRQVTVPPGGSQTVRVSVRVPPDLAPGRYETRMLFQAVPVGPPPRADGSDLDGDGVSIQLRAIFGFTVPIVVTHD